MAQQHKDGSNVRDILQQFQSQHDNRGIGLSTGDSSAQHSHSDKESRALPSKEAGDESPVTSTRPSLKQISRNVVNQKAKLFEKGATHDSETASDHQQTNTGTESASPCQQDDKPRRPVPPRRPPLAKKPPICIDSKPKVVAPKPKLPQGKDKSTKPTVSQENECRDKTKLLSKNVDVIKGCESGDGGDDNSEVVGQSHSKHESPECSFQSRDESDLSFTVKDVKPCPSQPPYSQVDKSKKKKKCLHSVQDSERSNSQLPVQVDSDVEEALGGEYARLRVSPERQDAVDSSQKPAGPSLPQIEKSPVPPKKPPRTFAHDDYMMQKQLKQQQKRAARENKKTKQVGEKMDTKQETDEFGYECVEFNETKPDSKQIAKPTRTVESKPKSSIKYRTLHHLPSSDDQSKSKQAVEKPTERPLPPPRPPPPSPKSTIDPNRFKKPQIFQKEHNRIVPKNAFISKGNVTNPSYEASPNIICIKHSKANGESGASGGLKRCKSDECLYTELETDSQFSEPIYMDPADVACAAPQGRQVVIDAEGYAVPDEIMKHVANGSHSNHTLYRLNSVIGTSPTKERQRMFNREPSMISPVTRRKPVQETLSKAYAVLRIHSNDTDQSAEASKETKDDESDSEVNPDEQQDRLHYVSTVKLKLSVAVRQSPYRTPEELRIKLFNYAIIMGLDKTEEMNRYKTKELFHFPHQSAEEIELISQFCFPDLRIWRPVTRYKSETFSFVLTDEHARRRYGYCMRFLPQGSGNRLPLVLCIVSALDAFMFYKKLLEEIREKYKISSDHAELLIKAAYATPLPDPGKEAWIVSEGVNLKRETIFLKRPADTRLENVSFSCLLACLSVDNLINVFASVLLERKIIFVAQHLSTLTSCIQALCALLYPFIWPHPFIPVLPNQMIEVCQSPTPLIVGVLTTQQPKLAEMNLDHVLMIDLDHNTLMKCQGDESRIIPKKLQKALRLALKDDGDCPAHDVLIMESFLRFFVETIGHYTEYICTQMDGEKIFEKKAFITSVSSKSIRMFLEWFVETQMFEVFITDKMESAHTGTLFETRIMEYREEMQGTPSIKQNVMAVGQRLKNFFMVSGDKIKKKFSSNVFI